MEVLFIHDLDQFELLLPPKTLNEELKFYVTMHMIKGQLYQDGLEKYTKKNTINHGPASIITMKQTMLIYIKTCMLKLIKVRLFDLDPVFDGKIDICVFDIDKIKYEVIFLV